MASVVVILLGCGIKYKIAAIVTEANAYLAIFFRGIFILIIFRITMYRAINIMKRADELIMLTASAEVKG